MIAILGVIEPYSKEARTALFFIITIGLVVASLLIVRQVRENALVILGLIVAAAAIGYSMLGEVSVQTTQSVAGAPMTSQTVTTGAVPFSETLMKIAVALVLAGVVRSLLWPASGSPVTTPTPRV